MLSSLKTVLLFPIWILECTFELFKYIFYINFTISGKMVHEFATNYHTPHLTFRKLNQLVELVEDIRPDSFHPRSNGISLYWKRKYLGTVHIDDSSIDIGALSLQ